MNGIGNNPVGMALLAACGLLVLVGLTLGLVWSGTPGLGGGQDADQDADIAASSHSDWALGPSEEYLVITERPLFNESRRPEALEVVVGDDQTEAPTTSSDVADRPDVRLTGIVITPEDRFVTLTPNKGGEPVTVRGGDPMEGEFFGWNVDGIWQRRARLSSDQGESFMLNLAIHDAMIEEPPEPEPPPSAARTDDAPDDDLDRDADERLSRAEEIRQRIAERREQLRQEAEMAEADEEQQRASTRSDYQEAIREMMQRNRTQDDNDSDEER